MWRVIRRLIQRLSSAPVAPPPLTRSTTIFSSTSPPLQFASWLMPDDWPRAIESTGRDSMRKLTLVEPVEAPPERLDDIPLDFTTAPNETAASWRQKVQAASRELAHARSQQEQTFRLRSRPWQRRP
jgi:hypothetical protein